MSNITEGLQPLARPIDSLTLHPQNYRQGDVENIAASLDRFGQVRPIVVQASTGHVVAGNHTLKAAISLDWDTSTAATFCDYLHIAGTDVNCDDLMLGDKGGSRSHRNGLCIVSGLDVYDWHASNPAFDGNYPKRLLSHLNEQAWGLLAEAQRRAEGQPWERDVNALTLESALCTYKGWHRPNRRYPGVYVDMLYDRIRQAEKRFPADDFTPFWQARADCLLDGLLIEKRRGDPGLHPLKQNHYRLTGEVPVMWINYPRYWSAFDKAVKEEAFGWFR